ncbi:MAG: mechanosensitive ion channel family protein [Parvularculaceae bacterium]|nr:mechanosensitive ion channel family protein [Parvularculaceae bacterium]
MRLVAIVVLWLALVGTAFAQSQTAAERETAIDKASAQLRQISAEIEAADAEGASSREQEIREIIAGSRSRLGPVNTEIQAVSDNLALLGPAPKENEPPEASAVAGERETFNNQLTMLRGQRTRILANIDEAIALLGDISKNRFLRFYSDLAVRTASLVTPDLWKGAAEDFSKLRGGVGNYFAQWQASSGDSNNVLAKVAALFAAFAISLFMLGPVQRWARRYVNTKVTAREPTKARRVGAAAARLLTRLGPGVIGGLAVIETARAIGLLQEDGLSVAHAIWVSLIAFLLAQGATAGLFSPAGPDWRLTDLEPPSNPRVRVYMLAIFALFGVKSVAVAIFDAAGGLTQLSQMVTGVNAVIIGVLLVVLSQRRMWAGGAAPVKVRSGADAPGNGEANGQTARVDESFWPSFRFVVRVIGVGVIAASVAGYVLLADFVVSRIYYLPLLIAVIWFTRALLKEATLWADRRLKSGKADGQDPAEDETQAFVFWVGAGVDVLVFVLFLPTLLALAGIEISSVRDIVMRAFSGFRIGGMFISLSDIFIAIGTFVAILIVTRGLQGALQRGPLAHSRIDPGIQNSLVTLFGYFGLVVAVVAAFSVMGFDLSNLALIAGALSVGIGFGLQSIVNNFVSGLILLFERPIKVGDWIVTNSGEGIVKKISVRSTDIETFDRSSIIIPNSELISSTVTNWTHRDRLGRIRVPVGVAYKSNPEQVRELLLQCANEHPLVVRYPEPFVVWQDFGASSLDFELRAYLRDISKGLQVKTELRYAIFEVFRKEGIEIPFPQQDLYVKSLPDGAPTPAPAPTPTPTPQQVAEPETDDDD